jgi:protein-S-isoprenylcysteine O-methyltransferase Ste14
VRFQRFIYSTRGLYLLIAVGVTLRLKHRAGTGVSLPVYVVLLVVIAVTHIWRAWAAGFVGTTARGREVYGTVLLTAGPYAHVRNPMYLGNLVILLCLCAMSGMWVSLPLALLAFAFVYSSVIPYEETYLRERFGAEYEAYYQAVPRLLPSLRRYGKRQGVFRLREGLANELFGFIVIPLLCYLFWVL